MPLILFSVFFLYSLVDGLNPEEIQDEDEMNMTTFGELFVDPTKMKVLLIYDMMWYDMLFYDVMFYFTGFSR